MALIECRDVCKNFGEKVALDHVSLDIPKGQIFGLLGPNGAGKTTMIRIINRITIPNSGEVLFDGRPITQKDVEKIGYLPEERGLYRKMEVGDQAMYLGSAQRNEREGCPCGTEKMVHEIRHTGLVEKESRGIVERYGAEGPVHHDRRP